jgi:hypothetical protein
MALMAALRVRVFEPASTGDNFTARGDDAAKEMAKRLRAYWKEYGALPFDERMMKVLTDPKTNFDAKREVAENIATDDRRFATTFQPTIIGADPPKKVNPAIVKFNKPTAAEAILAALDADLKAFDAEQSKDEPSLRAYKRRRVEGTYLSVLIELGDGRISPEAAKRAASAKSVRDRRQWAQVAHYLGDPKPFRAFAEDFRAGKIEFPEGKDQGDELSGALRALIGIETPETERALGALADPKHALHKTVTQVKREELFEQFLRLGADGDRAALPAPRGLVVWRLVQPDRAARVDVAPTDRARLARPTAREALELDQPANVAVEEGRVVSMVASGTGPTGSVSRALERPRWSPLTAASAW